MKRINLALTISIAALASCASSKAAELKAARSSGYDAEYQLVFTETVKAVQHDYKRIDANPQARVIKTAWHPLQIKDAETPRGRGVEAANQLPAGSEEGGAVRGRGSEVQAGGNPNSPSRRYFVRFDVSIEGARPFKIKVEGYASVWDRTGAPQPLHGADTPYWLKGKIESLEVAIYKQLRQYAVTVQ